MFDTALIRRIDNENNGIDLGRLAEALLFFSKVQLTLNAGSLAHLIGAIGLTNLFALIDNGRLSVTLFQQDTGIQRTIKGFIPVYRFIFYQFAGENSESKIKSKKDAALFFFHRVMDKNNISRADQKKILNRIPIKSISDRIDTQQDIYKACEDSFASNPAICDNAAKILLEEKFQIRPSNVYFRPIKFDGQYVFDTNIDFTRLNKRTPDREKWVLSEENILAYIFETQTDIALAASYQAGLMTVDGHSRLLKLRTDQLVRNVTKAAQDAEMFQDFLLSDLKSVRDVMNSGERDFGEFMKVLKDAQRFKDWLAGRNPDGKLANEYLKEITKSDFFDRLPGKFGRFSIFTGGGLLLDTFGAQGFGTAAGLGLSTLDTFVVDKLIRGWKPSHFIEGSLKNFVTPST